MFRDELCFYVGTPWHRHRFTITMPSQKSLFQKTFRPVYRLPAPLNFVSRAVQKFLELHVLIILEIDLGARISSLFHEKNKIVLLKDIAFFRMADQDN